MILDRDKEMRIGIPKGPYCHDNKLNVCVYWELRRDLPNQENGYCFLIGKSDWDINEEANTVEVTHFRGELEPYKTIESAHIYRVGLLWDKCKECGYLEC